MLVGWPSPQQRVRVGGQHVNACECVGVVEYLAHRFGVGVGRADMDVGADDRQVRVGIADALGHAVEDRAIEIVGEEPRLVADLDRVDPVEPRAPERLGEGVAVLVCVGRRGAAPIAFFWKGPELDRRVDPEARVLPFAVELVPVHAVGCSRERRRVAGVVADVPPKAVVVPHQRRDRGVQRFAELHRVAVEADEVPHQGRRGLRRGIGGEGQPGGKRQAHSGNAGAMPHGKHDRERDRNPG